MYKRVLAILAIAVVVSGQAPRAPQAVAPNAPPASLRDGPAPFDNELMRLAEILGALHYLRALCGAHEGSKWRDQMQDLLESEAAQPGPRRDRLVGNFNRGFQDFRQTYRTCTPAANLAVRRYLDEGTKIAREITARYAN
jgi:uncharacterized protein (TIGR02301 family)